MKRKVVSFFKTNFLLMFFVISYLILVFGSVYITRIFGGVTLIWPSSGMAFLLLSFFGIRGGTLLYFVSSYFFYKVYGSVGLALVHAVGPLLHGICALTTFRFFRRHFEEVGRLSDILGVIAAIVLGGSVGAVWTTTVLLLSGGYSDEMAIYNSIKNWTLSGSVGMLLFIPFFDYRLSDLERQLSFWKIATGIERKIADWFMAAIVISIGIFFSTKYDGLTESFVIWNLCILICCIICGSAEAYIAYLALSLFHLFRLFEALENVTLSRDLLNSSILELQIGILCTGLLYLIISKISQKKNLILSSFILLLFWIGSFFFTRYYEIARQKRIEAEFQILTERSIGQLREFLAKYNLLASFVGHEVDFPNITSKNRWSELITSMKLDSNFSGVVEVGVLYFDKGQVAGYKQGPTTNALPFIESLGLSNPLRDILNNAILRTRNLNTSVVSNFYEVNPKGNQKLFFYLSPKYKEGALIGWGYLLLDWEHMLRAFKAQVDRRIDFSVYTGNFSSENKIFGDSEKSRIPTLESFSRVYFSNHSLYIDWHLTPEVWRGEGGIELIFVTSTSLAALLVFLVFVTLIESKDNANRLVDRKEKELRQSQLQLLQASKMTAVGEMASGIAHEINNPLAIIKGRIGILESVYAKQMSGDGGHASMIEGFQIINRTVDRISKIIEGLRTFSRQSDDEIPFQDLQLSKIIDDTLDLCRERFRSAGIHLEVASTDAVVFASDTQLSQVFLNLLNNAFDAVVGTPEAWVRLEVLSSEQVVCLRFFDSGKGIPEDIVAKMMEPFFTTKEVGKGTGLGLSISNEIIKRHQGSLFYNREFPNTCIEIRLPLKLRS